MGTPRVSADGTGLVLRAGTFEPPRVSYYKTRGASQRPACGGQQRVATSDRADLIIHLIRNTFRLISRKYWDEIKRDLRPIYAAVNAAAAGMAVDELAEKWGPRYPAVIWLWRNAWEEFIPFLDYATSRSVASSDPSRQR